MSSVQALLDACKVTPGEGDKVEELPNGEVVYYRDPSHRYWWLTEEGKRPLVSVSSVLGVLDKPALIHWAWNLGREGRDFRDERNKASTRGTSVHDAAELLATTGKPPKLADFPEDDRGYVQALASWWLTVRPTVIATEVIVASLEHGYAGRFDLLCEIDGKRCLRDYKTSRSIHAVEMFAQLEAYELAATESGHPPTDSRGIVRLGEDGTFEEAESCASAADFLGVKAAFDARKRIDLTHKASKVAA